MSLRLRLLMAILALVAVGLLVADVSTYRFLRSSLIERVDRQLDGATFPAIEALTRNGPTQGGPFGHRPREGPSSGLLPAGTYAALIAPDGTVEEQTTFTFGEDAPSPPRLPDELSGSADAGPPTSARFTAEAQDGSISYRVLAEPLDPAAVTLVVAIPLNDVTATLRRLFVIEAGVTAAVLVGVGVLALWLVRRGLRPLDRMGETAGAIAAGDLSRRVESTDPRTEVGRLGVALNAMLAQIEEAFDERTRSEERLRQFVADASHELRTPLTSIRGYAELFRRGAADRPEDLALAMRRIEEEGSRMGELVEELLLLARLDQGRPLEREPVDLAEVVVAAVGGARAVDPGRRVDLNANGPVVVRGDANRLRQVIDNLLTNARQHTPAGTPVHVQIGTDGGIAVLEVRDEGPGIGAADAARVFERFYRADVSRSRDHGGVGLGLSIVAAVVEAHGGTVKVEERPGGGALFRIAMPLAEDRTSGVTRDGSVD
jgi:two-component system OmpR family sensor kinase